MKDLLTALRDELERLGKQPEEVSELILDSKCKTKSVKELGGLTNLQVLSLAHTGITSLAGFPSLPCLVELVLSDNLIAGGLEHLAAAGLTSLRKLDLANNKVSKLEDLQALKPLPIVSLDLEDCPVGRLPNYREEVLKMFDSLEYLDKVDRFGKDRDVDDEEEEEEYEGEEGNEEYDGEEGGGDGDGEDGEEENDGEEYEGDEGEGEEGEDEEVGVRTLLGEPIPDDEDDYEGDEEPEEDDEEGDDDEDEEEEEAGPSGGAKRKRDEEDEEEEEDEDDE